MNTIDPHDLLIIFLPVLIFESSFSADVFVLAKSKYQLMLLAGPGALGTAVILGFSLLYIFGYGYGNDLTIPQGLAIGAVLSTTDPVSVVALLKEIGANVKFNVLLEGESHFVDGTAMVMFLVTLDIVESGEFSFLDSTLMFFRLVIGGTLFGLLVGYLLTFWFVRIRKDNTLVILITFVTSYGVFFVSEIYFEISGTLALVAMGLYLGPFVRSHFKHETQHSMHTVWGFAFFTLETVIFVITGTFIGEVIYEFEHDDYETTNLDFVKAGLFYLFVMLIRLIVLFI